MSTGLRPAAVPAVLVLLLALVGCAGGNAGDSGTGDSGTGDGGSGSAAGAATFDGPIQPEDPLYVSIGDSYAAGYQPSGPDAGSTTANGFAYQVAARATGGPLRLVNFGCSGITSTGLLRDRGCAEQALGPGGRPYDGSTQATAAEEFLRGHRDQVRLVTVVVGGNDIKPCLVGPDGSPRPDAMECGRTAAASVQQNLAELLGGIRAAVGPDVNVVGLTYPDVFLGSSVSGGSTGQDLARTSVPMFRDVLNPVLSRAYADAGARFLDITADTGAYGPATDTVDLPPYGELPRPVAQVCTLTFVCQLGDVHPTNEGYRFIADRVLQAVAPR